MKTLDQERVAGRASMGSVPRALTGMLVASLLPFGALPAQGATAASVPDQDGFYLVARVVDHAVPGYLELSASGRPTWFEVGTRVQPTRATMTSRSAANDSYDLSFNVPKGSDGCTFVLLRIDGAWRVYQPNGGDTLSCDVGDRVVDTPAGFAARMATLRGTTPVVWRPFGERITATFRAAKPVFLQGEDPEIIFTIRNPADAPPAQHHLEPVSYPGPAGRWSFTITRDGVDIPQGGSGGSGGLTSTVLAPGDSAVTIFRPRVWNMFLTTPGHYIVRISHTIRFSPVPDPRSPMSAGGRGAPPSANPGGDQTFTGTVEFDVASALIPGATTVRGRVTGDSTLVALVGLVWLGAPADGGNRSFNSSTTQTAAPMTFVSIGPGQFMMGCSSDDTTCTASQRPAHQVRISRPFEIGAYEVTRAQWKAVMTTLPGSLPVGPAPPAAMEADDLRPVESVTWTDAQEFLRRLNGLPDGYHYRLPTEAEWEYAARAGTTTSGTASADETAWFKETSGGWAHPVGQKAPNAWGLYDMLGNVEELVQDFYGPYDAGAIAVDPTGPATGTQHIVRGGSAQYAARASSVSVRYAIGTDHRAALVGFRVVRERGK